MDTPIDQSNCSFVASSGKCVERVANFHAFILSQLLEDAFNTSCTISLLILNTRNHLLFSLSLHLIDTSLLAIASSIRVVW